MQIKDSTVDCCQGVENESIWRLPQNRAYAKGGRVSSGAILEI